MKKIKIIIVINNLNPSQSSKIHLKGSICLDNLKIVAFKASPNQRKDILWSAYN